MVRVGLVGWGMCRKPEVRAACEMHVARLGQLACVGINKCHAGTACTAVAPVIACRLHKFTNANHATTPLAQHSPTCLLHTPRSSRLQCGGNFVKSMLDHIRATPRFQSLMHLVPCDMWQAIRGRTLWLAGDRCACASSCGVQLVYCGRADGWCLQGRGVVLHLMTKGLPCPWPCPLWAGREACKAAGTCR